ncbi:Clavaminate synthase-like protein [Annulohypoxylon truncatum]|uniref:Clavaminate synthase-like protein n=1 Tax=Annulohypoxylon truncatum TaxID=327061 RepID=UPI0020072FDF|nr:Clavaminate synthase-like protein [Annulohypoxylon truncatum]KAI1214573.1 Clavaminate synthase-like protein [Annulohypoxylon truncatum]
MKSAVYISRGLLNSKSHHVSSGILNPSYGLGRTSILLPRFPIRTSRQFSTSDSESIPWLKGRRATTRIVSNNKRGFANLTEPTEPTEPAEPAEPTEPAEPAGTAGKNNSYIDLDDDDLIRITKPGTRQKLFDRHWLRDSCDCSICVDPDSGQKNFGTCDVPTNLPIARASFTDDGGLDIVWESDFLSQGNHESHYPIARLLPGPASIQAKHIPLPKWILWDKDIFEKDRLTIDYDEWMAGGSEFLSGLHRLGTHGLIFLRNVPPSDESVVSIANQIGNIQETFYGRTWDVRSKPNAENVAYTNSFLGLHQDLLYLAFTPRIQLLHCLENTCEGGDSLFSDGARASHLIRLASNNFIEHLSTKSVRYAYNKHGHVYENFHPVLDKFSSLTFWSPPFQSSDQNMIPRKAFHSFYRKWLEAATKFRHLIEDEQWMYQYKMQPGECVLFDNLRILHGRKQFDTATGSRHLKGTYIAKDVYLSKLKSVSPELMALESHKPPSMTQQTIKLNNKHKVWDEVKDPKLLEEFEKYMAHPRWQRYKMDRLNKPKNAKRFMKDETGEELVRRVDTIR